jgi:virginiamycin B lyase
MCKLSRKRVEASFIWIAVLLPGLPAVALSQPQIAIGGYAVPTANAGTYGITLGPDGALWFTESGFSSNKIGRITTAEVISSEYPVPTANSGLSGITLGPDGALWFTENVGSKIRRITTAGLITEYPVPGFAS